MVDLAYLKSNVFPGESGGDYDALYGYANRQGGAFAGVRPSQMTVAQVVDLTDPRGSYAQWVRGQLGYTATPVGAYQVVGSTLRDAVKGLGLTGNEPFNQATQDAIAQWIYQQQGPGAWEGWGKGGGNVTMSSSGGPSMAGLLDYGQQEPQPFGQRLKQGLHDGSLMDNLALAFNSLRLNPDQGIGQLVQARQEQRGEQRTVNRTAQWLASQGREDLAQAMLSGALDPKSAAAIAMTPPEDNRTAMIQNYEYWLGQGKTPDEAAEMARAGSGGSVTTIDMGGGGKFEEAFGKGDAERLAMVEDTGLMAIRNISRIDHLDTLLREAPQGMEGGLKLFAGEFGIPTEGLDDIQAAQALINSLVPEQRAPGSGPMSDADLALFKQSLPRIINQPGGNSMIVQTMRAIAQYDAMGANIVQMVRDGQIDRAEAFRRLKERPDPLANIRNQLGGDVAPAGGAGTGTGGNVIRYDKNGNRIQ